MKAKTTRTTVQDATEGDSLKRLADSNERIADAQERIAAQTGGSPSAETQFIGDTIARYRRNGAEWNEVRERLGLKWNSTRWAKLLAECGYNAGGERLDGTGPRSKALFAGKNR